MCILSVAGVRVIDWSVVTADVWLLCACVEVGDPLLPEGFQFWCVQFVGKDGGWPGLFAIKTELSEPGGQGARFTKESEMPRRAS
jgi:hypothetical protein